MIPTTLNVAIANEITNTVLQTVIVSAVVGLLFWPEIVKVVDALPLVQLRVSVCVPFANVLRYAGFKVTMVLPSDFSYLSSEIIVPSTATLSRMLNSPLPLTVRPSSLLSTTECV